MASPPTVEKSPLKVRGLLSSALQLLASLKLAVVLIVVLAIVLTVATFLEAAKGREYAQWYVYGSQWFVALLALLAANILAASLIRFPWKTRHIGFLVTHAGLLLLLIGSIQTFVAGIDGHLSFEEGEDADSIFLTNRSELTVFRKGPEGRIFREYLSFNGGAVDWPQGRELDFGPFDGIGVKVLKFYRHARHGTTFYPVKLAPGQTIGPEAAVLVEITSDGKTQQVWLKRDNKQYGIRRVVTSQGPLLLSFGYENLPLGFSLKLLDFQRLENPGGMGNASFASFVQLLDPAEGIDQQKEISMNSPLVHGKFTFYQSSFQELPGGKELSVLSVTYDPGRFMKYLGSLMICVGIFVMYCMKSPLLRKLLSVFSITRNT